MVFVLRLAGRIGRGSGAGAGHSPRGKRCFIFEAFPAAALIFHIRIVEFETSFKTSRVKSSSVRPVGHALGSR
jgi:hypothetical protein